MRPLPLLLCAVLLRGVACTPHYERVLSAHHFDAVTLGGDGRFARAAVLVMYTHQCEHRIAEYGIMQQQLPPPDALFLAVHDYVTAPIHTWYDYPEADGLAARYGGVSGCFSALFFPAGSSYNATPAVWQPAATAFREWVWDNVRVTVTLSNSLDEELTAEFVGRGPKLDGVVVKAQDELKVMVYLSYIVVMTDKNGWVKQGGLVSHLTTTFVVARQPNAKRNVVTKDVFVRQMQADLDVAAVQSVQFYNHHAERELINLKQPVICPNFTETGYTVQKMQGPGHRMLREFFFQVRARHQTEYQPPVGHVRFGEKPARLAHLELDRELYDYVPSIVQPELERWCRCHVTPTHVYGVWEYYTGHVINSHLGSPDSQVFTAILQVAKDLGEQRDWDLEVVDFHGKRQRLVINSGEMLMFESAKLIHGRPNAFQGKAYATVVVHFAPLYNWPVVFNGSHIMNHAEGIIEPLNDYFTEVTTTKPILFSERHPQHVRDEL